MKKKTVVAAQGTLHMGISKETLILAVRELGASAVFPGFGGSDDEAVRALEEDPRSVIVSCGCEKNEDGSCSGKSKH